MTPIYINLREPYFVIGQCLEPIYPPKIELLVPLILSKQSEEMLPLCVTQKTALFWEIWHEHKHKDRDNKSEKTLDDENPPEALQSGNSVHIPDTIRH